MSQENAPIWRKPMSLEGLNASSRNTLMAHLGILYTAFGPDWLEASMPVDHRTHQPLGAEEHHQNQHYAIEEHAIIRKLTQ